MLSTENKYLNTVLFVFQASIMDFGRLVNNAMLCSNYPLNRDAHGLPLPDINCRTILPCVVPKAKRRMALAAARTRLTGFVLVLLPRCLDG